MILAIIAVLVIIITAFNLIKSTGKLKKIIKISNMILYSVLIVTIISYFVQEKITSYNSTKYYIEGGFVYDGTRDGYHIFYRSAILDGGWKVAIPDKVKLSPLVRLYPSVDLYASSKYNIEPNIVSNEQYDVIDNVVKAVADFGGFLFSFGLLIVAVISVANPVYFIIVLCFMWRNRKKLSNNSETKYQGND